MTLNIDIKEEQAKSQKVIAEQGLRVLVCAGMRVPHVPRHIETEYPNRHVTAR